mmetsp:Transcript_117031/g.338309  ORF Transcript_117031/g.338309 Transcript_117031/m.338309 type:complete len:202 (+) Transcript_117031:1075-1680(+)
MLRVHLVRSWWHRDTAGIIVHEPVERRGAHGGHRCLAAATDGKRLRSLLGLHRRTRATGFSSMYVARRACPSAPAVPHPFHRAGYRIAAGRMVRLGPWCQGDARRVFDRRWNWCAGLRVYFLAGLSCKCDSQSSCRLAARSLGARRVDRVIVERWVYIAAGTSRVASQLEGPRGIHSLSGQHLGVHGHPRTLGLSPAGGTP